MRLKIRQLKLNAGRPVVILSNFMAEKLGVHTDERVVIKTNSHKIIAVVDTSQSLVSDGEIALSSEVLSALGTKKEVDITILPAPRPVSLNYISKKLEGGKLSRGEIYCIISDIVKNALTESEIAYFVSAVYKCGMSMEEVAYTTEALFRTGKSLGLKNKLIVDKHSIGGVAGNRITPIVVSICSSLGLTMPKTSSRAITSASGTADTLETLCKVDFTIPELKKIIHRVNACMVWGGALGLAPGDDKLIQVERLLNLDPESQLLSSIMAKKVSVGSKYVLMDLPCGPAAKVTFHEAKALAKKFIFLGKYFKMKIACEITDGSQPIGWGIGPALEMRDILSVLTGGSVQDLENKSVLISGRLLELCGKAKKNTGAEIARKVLYSGDAYDKFKEIITAQKGHIKKLKDPKYKHEIAAEKSGRISEINNKKINQLARISGSPLDKFAGVYLHKHNREKVEKGNVILDIYAESDHKLQDAIKFYRILKPITIT